MNPPQRDRGHVPTTLKAVQPTLTRMLLTAACVSILALAGCRSGASGHAPGLAGPQTLDPGTFTYPLAYIKRPPPTKDIDAGDLITSTAGGDLYIRAEANAGGLETNLTQSITKGAGDVRDLDVSPDGKKLIFSLRLPLNPNKPNTDVSQPTWKLYQYDAAAKTVTQLTNDTSTKGHDVGAHYLPDGRIVFSSTRQAATQQLLVDENRPQYPAQDDARTQPIFLLHVMNADGTNIHQISFNTNHDFAPSVLANGQIVFSRYESLNGGQISLYRANPDGSKLELYYGANSHATGASIDGTNANVVQFLNARQRADGKLLAIVRPLLGTQLGGDIVQIDAANYVECDQTAVPGTANGTCNDARPAQLSATSVGVTTDAGKPSMGGRFASVYPLFDGTNRMLVSWSPCFVANTTVTPATTSICTAANTSGATVTQAPPAYTLWVYDISAGTLTPILASEPGLSIVEPVILQARTPLPAFIPDAIPTGSAAALANNSNAPLGLLDIRSVYDFDGVDTVPTQTNPPVPSIAALADPSQTKAAQRPARFIRIEKAVEIPDKTVRKINGSAFGRANMGMREILAYAPIEPDGSVRIQVPANVPFTIDILDANGRRISAQHTSWLQLTPGETKTCNGCHTAGSKTTPSHGRAGLTKSAYAGAAASGMLFPNTLTFPPLTAGDTMAEARVSDTCQTVTPGNCSEVPSIDLLFTDVWTNPALRPVDPPIAYAYANLNSTKPINAHCGPPQPWDGLCRSNIDYPLHIQPVWNFVRQITTGTTVTDHTCVLCHNQLNAANAFQVPGGQLDLTGGPSTVDMTVATSYEQLLFAHDAVELNNTNTGFVIQPPPPVPAPMAAGSAINSQAFFLQRFDPNYNDPNVGQNGYIDHRGFLNPAELRLISEWLDIGAQYYNDPFVAPVAN